MTEIDEVLQRYLAAKLKKAEADAEYRDAVGKLVGTLARLGVELRDVLHEIRLRLPFSKVKP